MSQKARLGSLEYVASSEPSSSEAAKIREAAGNSVYSKELVQAALSVNKKVVLFLNWWILKIVALWKLLFVFLCAISRLLKVPSTCNALSH